MGSGGPGSIAVIGDLHSAWDDDDVQVMPGNNDAPHHSALAAELAYRQGAKALLRNRDRASSPQAQLCGYSSHSFMLGREGITIIAGRPFSMGGPELTFAKELAHDFGIGSLEQSTQRIVALAEAAPTRDLIFLSHNGPAGLGANAQSMWGRDFERPAVDWGDPDLALALEHLQARTDKRVLAVIAGHMHTPIRGGAERETEQRRGETLYLNPARVPRIFQQEDGSEARHHVELAWHNDVLSATQRLIHLE